MSSNTDIIEIANKITENFAVLSNVYRTLILMHLYKNDNSTWSKIKDFIEKNIGSVNPNTLHFHLKALIHAGYVKRSGSEDSSIYQIDKTPDFILQVIKESVNND